MPNVKKSPRIHPEEREAGLVGQAIRWARRNQGYRRQIDLAKLADRSSAAILSKIESDPDYSPRPSTLKRYAVALGYDSIESLVKDYQNTDEVIQKSVNISQVINNTPTIDEDERSARFEQWGESVEQTLAELAHKHEEQIINLIDLLPEECTYSYATFNDPFEFDYQHIQLRDAIILAAKRGVIFRYLFPSQKCIEHYCSEFHGVQGLASVCERLRDKGRRLEEGYRELLVELQSDARLYGVPLENAFQVRFSDSTTLLSPLESISHMAYPRVTNGVRRIEQKLFINESVGMLSNVGGMSGTFFHSPDKSVSYCLSELIRNSFK